MTFYEKGLVIGFFILGLRVIRHSFFSVDEGHMAILSSLGKIIFETGGKKPKTFAPGLHFKKPWAHVHSASIMEQLLELSSDGSSKTAMTEDGTILKLDTKLRYRITPEKMYDYFFSLTRPLQHINGLFVSIVRNEIASFGTQQGKPSENGSFALIRNDRKNLNQKIETYCKNRIATNYGIEVNAVEITEIYPPEELDEALNAVINAQSDVEVRYSRSQAECEQRILAAEKSLEIAKSQSKAVEEEILELCRHLSVLDQQKTLEEYVERRTQEVYSESKITYSNGGR